VRDVTFDCYGTLIDWDGGIRSELARLFGEDEADRLLERYHELEPKVQSEDPGKTYRDVMAEVLKQLAKEQERSLKDDERDALGRSLPTWRPFPEAPEALAELRDRGWRLGILSNTDRDFIEASITQLGVEFAFVIVASEIGSYKPMTRHWERFDEEAGADRARHVHVGASIYHDIKPARSLGILSVWINRLGEETEYAPTRELPDLRPLPDTLDELVPLD
jgi:2-haloalkanoic acid dehalogenase type II